MFDTNVVVSAAFWPTSSSRRCFLRFAKRQFQLTVTDEILEEYYAVAERVRRREFPAKNPQPFLDWIAEKALRHEPVSLGKQRCRDLKDDIFIAGALTSGAGIIVSKDNDLLVLEKPFGIDILTPHSFLARLSRT